MATPDLMGVGASRLRPHGFLLASAFSLALFTALVGNAVLAQLTSRRVVDELTDREAIQDELVRLDTRLQSAARSAVATGVADGWGETHRQDAEAFRRILVLLESTPSSGEMSSALVAAERARDLKTRMEGRALELVDQGRSGEARSVLQQPEYHEQGHQFAHAMQHFESVQLEEAVDGIRRADARLRSSMLWAAGLFVLLTGTWVALLRASRRREKRRAAELEERKAAQHALADSLSKYRALFEASNDNVFLVSTSSLTVVDVNQRACTTLGVKRSELEGRLFSGICEQEMDRTEEDEPVAAALTRMDGTQVPVTLRKCLVRVHGQDFWQVAARDLSTCRSLEAQLQRAQRMESLGQLARGIAHEFSNLALTVAGYASLARRAHEREESIGPVLDRIEAVAAESRRISRSLMCFSGRANFDRRAVDVRAVTRETVKLMAHVLPMGVRLEGDGLDGPPLMALADEAELEQILLNLALNARDAMPSGGRLGISCRAADDGEIELEVEDEGSGIAPENLGRIFEPLFTTKPPGSGTGLGLSIVERLVRGLGGRIQVRSEPGGGTRFRVRLPGLERARGPVESQDHPELGRRQLAIRLAVECGSARHLLRTEFESRGHRVYAEGDDAGSGAVVDLAIVAGEGVLPDGANAQAIIRIGACEDPGGESEEERELRLVGGVSLSELVRIAESMTVLQKEN